MFLTNLNLSTTTVLLLGLAFHLIYILSVFDCYFTSPVVHGMQHYKAGDGSAKRLVLFVADGLRADLLYNLNPFPSIPDSPEVVAPYLREVVEKRGAFGVSHTRVPTESRPGHVAIIGGMYEDVSAVTKGWKDNPVDFDSVFNQSRHTFSFGSPDILPMFARGAERGKVDTWMYNEDDEDFTKDATELDIWVYDQLHQLFSNASSDIHLDNELRGEQTVFFLHLLGLDTTGHSYRPHSKEYMRNIQVVDNVVAKTEALFRDFFQDEETAYLFTADHGMSNIGNHGDGNPDSTRTPLIAWGAGFRGPVPDVHSSSHDSYSEPWGLSHLFRRDVEQADLASLMSAVIGINYPVNSVGVLPEGNVAKPGYLSFDSEEQRAQVVIANSRSILEHYRVKHKLKSERKLFFKPFSGLATMDEAGSPGSGHLLHIEHLLGTHKWADACNGASELIELSLEGLRYLETYDRVMLQAIVTAGYLGWSLFTLTSLLFKEASSAPQTPLRQSNVIIAAALLVFASFCALFVIQRESWTYYLYISFPCYFWCISLLRITRSIAATSAWDKLSQGKRSILRYIQVAICSILSLSAMVHAYRERSIWSGCFVLIGIIWPLLGWDSDTRKKDYLYFKWAFVCLVTGIFPLRNVEQSEDLSAIIAGGIVMCSIGFYLVLTNENIQLSRRANINQLGLVVASMLVSADSVVRLTAKEGLPLFNQVFGWLILASSLLLPLLFPFRSLPPESKLLTLFLAFAPCFVILSICAEGLFYIAYCVTLLVWVEVEAAVRAAHNSSQHREGQHKDSEVASERKAEIKKKLHGDDYKIRIEDVRIALFFLFFVQVAFFGTGNVASISSFYLEPVYRLVPIFSPFLMAALLIFKIIAPYVILSAMFAVLNERLSMPPYTVFFIALSLTDGMTIAFFRSVTDRGSWLEIGQSISFFVITSLLLVWSAGICALGTWLMRGPTCTDQTIESKKDR